MNKQEEKWINYHAERGEAAEETNMSKTTDYVIDSMNADISDTAIGYLIARLRELLLEYGRHAEGCSGEFGYPCKCGWTNVLKEVEKGGRE